MELSRFAIAMVIFTMATSLFAQQRTKMCFQLMNYLEQQHTADAQINVFIHGASDKVGAAVRTQGGLVKQSLPRLVHARLPIANIHALAQDPAVERFEFNMYKAELLNDSARVKSRINEIHAGMAPLPQGYDGEGVIMGVIDTGLDVLHGDFLDENGDTRVLKYWDQVMATGPLTPPDFGYGQVWSSSHINAGEMTTVDGNGHGTSVAGIAAGNGGANGMHKGIAPKADMIIVKNPTGGPNFYSTVVDAVEFIFNEAEALGRPAVINISLGSRMGSHDGLDAAAQLIDAMLLERRGRAIVCAGGNFNELDPYHLRTNVTSDTSFTWFQYNPNMNWGNGVLGGVYFEAWADAAQFQNVNYAIGADRVNPSYQFRGRTPFHNVAQNLGVTIVDTLYSASGNRIGVVNFLALQRGGQYHLQVWMRQPDSTAYRFRFMSTGSGLFDIWSHAAAGWSQMAPSAGAAVPTASVYPAMASYVYPDRNMHITDSWTCSPHVITSANYRNETGYLAYDGSWQQGVGFIEGEITASSSHGPTRDGRIKPELAAPGDVTFTAYPLASLAFMMQYPNEVIKLAPGGMHIRGGGTSSTSPHIAGAVALYLQKCPTASHTEIRNALFSTAVTDGFTGIVPNPVWGYGKLDAFAALNTSNIGDVQIDLLGDVPFCSGDMVTLMAPDGFDQYTWSTGDTGNPLEYGEEGAITVTVYDVASCSATSAPVELTTIPSPSAPVIVANGGELTSSPADSYQWFMNGVLMEGFTTQTIEVFASGSYHVQITAANGCTAESEPVVVISTSVDELATPGISIWPTPARDELNIRLRENSPASLTILDATGKIVLERANGMGTVVLPLQGLQAGTYYLRVANGSEKSSMYRFVKIH